MSQRLGEPKVVRLRLSVAKGFPPKVVCLAIGNASNAATAALLLQQAETVETFWMHPEAGFLLLSPLALEKP